MDARVADPASVDFEGGDGGVVGEVCALAIMTAIITANAAVIVILDINPPWERWTCSGLNECVSGPVPDGLLDALSNPRLGEAVEHSHRAIVYPLGCFVRRKQKKEDKRWRKF